jgi:hypothetical protein
MNSVAAGGSPRDRDSGGERGGGVVALELTQRQAMVLAHVVRRAQEDPEFFGAVPGGDRRATTTLRITLSQVADKLEQAT